MVLAVLLVAVVNLALGAALAIVGEQPWQLLLPAWPGKSAPAAEPQPGNEPSEELAADWQKPLREAQLSPGSLVEKVLWVIVLELPRVRAEMEPIDQLLRHPERPEFLDGQLRDTNEKWIEQLELWSAGLLCGGDPAPHAELAGQLDECLLDNAFAARQVADALLENSKQSPLPLEEVRRQLVRLYLTVDTLRDFCHAQLAGLLRDQSPQMDAVRGRDSESETISRLGMESLFDQWVRSDEERLRIVSCVLLDVDRMGKLNARFGPLSGDQTLAALGRLLQSVDAAGQGVDHSVVRYTGQSFLIFMGDTAMSNAAADAERLRQTVEVTSFQVAGQAIELTVSAGVAEFHKFEAVGEFLLRLQSCVTEAKNAGRNRTAIDSPRGPRFEPVPQYQVERREIIVD